MDKRTLRGLAAGLFLSALLLIGFGQWGKSADKGSAEKPGYLQIKKEDYQQLKKEAEGWKKKYEAAAQTDKKKAPEEDLQEQETVKSYHLSIQSGMTSKEISELLEKAGIIDKSESFDDYLAQREAQHLIQIGEYELNSGMNFKELAELITREK